MDSFRKCVKASYTGSACSRNRRRLPCDMWQPGSLESWLIVNGHPVLPVNGLKLIVSCRLVLQVSTLKLILFPVLNAEVSLKSKEAIS